MKADVVNVVYQTDLYRLVCTTFTQDGDQDVKIVPIRPIGAYIVPVVTHNELPNGAILQRWNGV